MSRVEELEKQITELDERKVALKKELEVEKQKTAIEYPLKEDECWRVNSFGEIIQFIWVKKKDNTQIYDQGNIFKTKQETERERDKRILLTLFRQYRDKCNGEWKPQLREMKYYIFLNCTDFNCSVSYDTVCNAFNLFGYFKHKTDCKRAIELFGDEIKRLYVEE